MLTTEVKYTLVDDLSAKVAKIEARLSKFDKLIGHTDDNLKKLGKHGTGGFMDKLLPNNSKVEKITGALSEIPNLNMGILSSAGTLANPYVLAGAAVVAFGAYAVDSTRMANEWNVGMSKANVTIQATPKGLKEISEKLQKMKTYGADLMTIPTSFEKIISGVGDVTKAMDIMEISLKSARANSASVDVTGDAIVNIMGSAGKQFQNATQISDMLTKTKILGKAEFEDMATYLPRVIPYANLLGISVNEVAGSMALLTAKGQTTEQTTMLLQNAFVALADPKKRGNIEKFVKVFDHGKMRPFVNILKDLKTEMKGMGDQDRLKILGALDLDSQAASAFQQLIDNTDLLKTNITDIANATGATNKALADSANSQDGINRLKEKWDKLKLSLGEKILPFWEKFTNGLADLWDWLEKVEQKTGYFSSAWKIVSSVFKMAYAPFLRLWNMGKLAYSLFERFGNFMRSHFPDAFSYVGTIVKGITAVFRDLFFTISETYDMLANLITLDWGKLGGNIDNFKNHKYMDMSDAPVQYTQEQIKTMYDNAIAKGVSKDKLDAMAKKWGVAIPGTAPKDVPPTNTGASLMPTSTGMGDDDKKKAKHKADRAEQGLREVAGGGSQVRNVTIHIGKQIEKVEIATTNLQNLSKEAVRKILEELMVTTVRDSEIMLAH